MGKYNDIAQQIARILNNHKCEGSALGIPEITRILGEVTGFEANSYPGNRGETCYPLCLILSLNALPYKRKKGHLSYRQAMESLVKHMQGSCSGQTTEVVFISDEWNINAYHEWENNLVAIRKNALVEFYLVTGGLATAINA